MNDFFRTPMGRTFFESTLPRLVKAIERVADALEKEAHKETEFPASDDAGVSKDGVLKRPDFADLPYEILSLRDGQVALVIGRSSVESEAIHRWRATKMSAVDPRYTIVLTFQGRIIKQ